MAGLDLIRHDAEPFVDESPAERRREEPVLGAQDVSGRHLRPRIQGPRLVEATDRPVAPSPHRLLGDRTRHVVEEGDERILVAREPTVDRRLLTHGLP